MGGANAAELAFDNGLEVRPDQLAYQTIGDESTASISIVLGKNSRIGYHLINKDSNNNVPVPFSPIRGSLQARDIIIDTRASSSEWDAGLWAQGQKDLSDDLSNTVDRSVLTVTASKLDIKSNYAALVAYSGSEIDITADTVKLTGKNIISTRGGSRIKIDATTTQLEGNIEFSFADNSRTSVVSDIDLTLSGKDSYWTGNSFVIVDSGNPSITDLEVNNLKLSLKNGANWTPTQINNDGEKLQERWVNLLNLDNGVVNLNRGVETGVKTLSGSGTFNVAVNSADHKTGKFNVDDGQAAGELKINLTGVDSDTVDVGEAQRIVANAITGDVNGKLAINIAEGNYNDAISVSRDGKVTKTENKKMRDSVVMHRGSTGASIRMLGNDIRKRLGDLRYTDSQNGSWVRYDGGRMSASGISNKFNTLQFGYDTADLVDNVRLGAALSYTRSDAELRSGSADVDTYSMAMYGAWMADNGMFADVIARVATVKNETMLGTAKGDLDNMVYALSGEFGQRFDVAKNFFVEPQVELTYTYVDSDSMKMSSDTTTYTYKYDSIDSLIGRAGVAVGLTCPNQKGQIYARASVVREFMGDTTVTGGDRSMKEDGQDTWAEIGLGAQYNINKNAYVWADVERTQGADINEDFRGTVGVRFNF